MKRSSRARKPSVKKLEAMEPTGKRPTKVVNKRGGGGGSGRGRGRGRRSYDTTTTSTTTTTKDSHLEV